MIIEKLIVKQLYGYIDKNIDFNKDITLLVGINGSGKTSILNILNWIVSPSLADLCVTEFEEISLFFKLNKKKYQIRCDHIDSQLRYQIFTKGKIYNPLIVDLNLHPRDIKNDDALRLNLHNSYKSLAPDKDEKETWDLIHSFPNPTIIGLDRYIYTEETPDLIYYENGKERTIRNRARKSSSPLDRVKEIINKEYRKRKNAILNLTNGLKNQLMLSTFDGSINRESFISGTRYKLDYNKIDQAEIRVREYFSKFEKNSITVDERKTIGKYFSKLKEITKEYQKHPEDEITKLLYALNAHQFIKVRNLLKEFEEFEKKSKSQMQQVQDFLDTLNHFLKDSAKKILFREDTSELTFNTLDKDGNVITEYKDISYLSSGEQQILILFSYIAFNSQDGKIFIIDEPELSLHIKWQEDFLEKLEKITPKLTQLILATHSPILANKKKSKSIVLLPYNN